MSRELLRAMFDAAVARADPARCLPPHLPEPPPAGRLIVLACGKCGAGLAAAAEDFYLGGGLSPGRLSPDRLVGICVTRRGYGRPLRRIRLVEAGHPVPDEAGLEGTADTLRLARSAGPDDLVLVLLSGGGSANWVAPAEGVTLADKQAVTRALLKSGAPIGEINAVRKHLSRIKGGRLAAAIHPARSLTLAISDVPGDDPAVIASGPTVPDPTTAADAQAILARRAIDAPACVLAALASPAAATPKAGDPVFADAAFRIVARPAESLAAAAALARDAGYDVVELGDALEGEARAVGAAHAKLALDHLAAGQRAAILSGGELTVTVTGGGRGGPNQEYALALAAAWQKAGLAGGDLAALAADTDGTDGGAGSPDDPAGAFVDADALRSARAASLSPAAFLANNDATGFFERVGGTLATGPTGVNVNDFRCILVQPTASRGGGRFVDKR